MPQRRNFFQDVVTILYEHLNGEVTASAMLTDKVTGQQREVDVLITADVAGQTILVQVEATSRGRKGTVSWVEEMLCKQADLGTIKLVLVSEAGFTKNGLLKAERKGVAALTPHDLTGDDPVHEVVNKLQTVWLKRWDIEILGATVWVDVGDGVEGEGSPGSDEPIYENGVSKGTMRDWVHVHLNGNIQVMMEGLDIANVAEDCLKETNANLVGPWRDADGNELKIEIEGSRNSNGDPERFEILRAKVPLKVAITVRPVDLTHKRLATVADYAAGEVESDGEVMRVVFSESDAGSKASVQLQQEGKWLDPVELQKPDGPPDLPPSPDHEGDDRGSAS
jgi:hypothetical protein